MSTCLFYVVTLSLIVTFPSASLAVIICRLNIQWKDFSVKSNVYSIDVLLLEIIANSKNFGYYSERYPDINLVGHVSWLAYLQRMIINLVSN